jgi:hypothetical protein
MFIQPVNDFHSLNAFLHEKLDNLPLLHSMTSDTFWNGLSHFDGASRLLASVTQSDCMAVLLLFRHPIRGPGSQ